MFELPQKFGNAIYESTYTGDYQRKKKVEDFVDESLDQQLWGNKELHSSFQDLSQERRKFYEQESKSDYQPLYKTYKYGLLPIFKSKKIDGINYFRSHMDPSVMNETKRSFNVSTSYQDLQSKLPKYSHKAKIPTYIKRDGYFHTNSEKNVRYLKSYNGSLIPYIPAFSSLKKPLPAIGTSESFHEKDFPDNIDFASKSKMNY